MNPGVIRAVKDLVVIVVFDDDFPDIHEVVIVDDLEVPLLVDSLQADNQAVCLNFNSDGGLQKGMKVKRTGKSIKIPVGNEMMGRRVAAMGMLLDGFDPVQGPGGARDIF